MIVVVKGSPGPSVTGTGPGDLEGSALAASLNWEAAAAISARSPEPSVEECASSCRSPTAPRR